MSPVAAVVSEGPSAPFTYVTPKPKRRRRLTTLRLVRLVPDSSFLAPSDYPEATAIRSPRDVYAAMLPYVERELGESFWILALNTQHRLIDNAPIVITRGILNSSLVHPREVFHAAIAANAAAIILCHNHPSGDPTPSGDDRVVTDQLISAGRIMDIPVHDHVIIGRDRYVSFAEAGLI